MNLYQRRKQGKQQQNKKANNKEKDNNKTNNKKNNSAVVVERNTHDFLTKKSSSTFFEFPSVDSADAAASAKSEHTDTKSDNILVPDRTNESMKSKKGTTLAAGSMDKGLQAINQLLLSVVGQPRTNFATKTNPITDDYNISQNVLGLGINGKVVEVTDKRGGDKCALKVLKDNAKSRREVELHWRSSACKHIVNIKAVYENFQKGQKCLLVVMEL